jgi:hypothetical protein
MQLKRYLESFANTLKIKKMTSIQYYYLDGIDKKGPCSREEIVSKNLAPTTLIYFVGLSNWTPLSQFDELKQPFSVGNVQNNEIRLPDSLQDSKKATKKIKIPSILFLILGLSLTTFFSYLYTANKKENDLNNIEIKVNDVFQGKDEVCDYKNEGVRGKLKNAEIFTPKDNEGNRLVEYYECERGGWTVLTLKRLNNGFEYTESYSTNMGFKVPESNYTPRKDFGYGLSTEGYSIPTNRGTVQNAYKEAMYYISTEKENKSYVAGSYLKIKTFDEISTEFYYISNVAPTKYSDGSVFAKSWSSSGEASVFNSDWIVWYKRDGKHYEIVERQKQFNKYWLIYSAIYAVTIMLIYLFLKYRSKISLQVT